MDSTPLPWLAPSLVAWLDERLATRSDLTYFEWGCGGSTLWFADRCKQVVSIEHSTDWVRRVRAKVSNYDNVHLFHIRLGFAYWDFILFYPTSSIILIDGRHRKACAERAALISPPLLLWDDAQRPYYQCSMSLFPSYHMRDFTEPSCDRICRVFIKKDGPLKDWI